jgi:hypothetical protein
MSQPDDGTEAAAQASGATFDPHQTRMGGARFA